MSPGEGAEALEAAGGEMVEALQGVGHAAGAELEGELVRNGCHAFQHLKLESFDVDLDVGRDAILFGKLGKGHHLDLDLVGSFHSVVIRRLLHPAGVRGGEGAVGGIAADIEFRIA